MNPPHRVRARTQAAWRGLEHRFDAVFGAAANPLRHLGALGMGLFWIVALSGIYLYAVLDTSATGAWRSIDALSRDPGSPGGLLRSLHHYAADAFVVVVLLHLTREWLFGRYAGFRRFSWLTGVPLLPLAFVSAIGGFWLAWDRLGQYSALATAEWLDVLPFFATPLTRNFLGAASVGDRLFSLFVFVHIGVPLLLVFGLWFHLQRVSRAEVFPARSLAFGSAVALLALAVAAPVRSQPPADLSSVAATLPIDWLLLFVHPLAQAVSGEVTWLLLALALALLFGLPFLPRRVPAAPVAQVDPLNCNGCRRCFDDCPYAAITMVPHPAGRPGRQLAEVDADRCASCGICAGACPSSTPFRGIETLVTGIDMPQGPVDALRRRLRDGLAAMRGAHRFVVFGCDPGARVDGLAAPDVLATSLLCTGMLPPSFVEYALRHGADGVLVTSCRDGGCAFRLGARWTAERLAGRREPHLRDRVTRERWRLVQADAGEEAVLIAALDELRRSVPSPAASPAAGASLRVVGADAS
ncbi:MAG: cytochrome b N-terminal domain-containing protein [Caldimonas sp.]